MSGRGRVVTMVTKYDNKEHDVRRISKGLILGFTVMSLGACGRT